ncbi:uncharacterized protein MYCFIDRAFT_183958 [Pseudocercospora fijiensis CIRAD86]|uniref:Uncharacterized protein n=1 Tax=Pseudocercospora fijiensis (strain CIRAD86) TaxID=383855 RepID=M3AMI9_PSEFD|nr:uncharacterized protein MYCFIDRAFT_183958 [Pseudocercospora fijiensis CIRAD86]EME78672.1 hypothetical protein MYCFIDRAFT_183958 [Pseudocercospora fijiensis CIRAD86]
MDQRLYFRSSGPAKELGDGIAEAVGNREFCQRRFLAGITTNHNWTAGPKVAYCVAEVETIWKQVSQVPYW